MTGAKAAVCKLEQGGKAKEGHADTNQHIGESEQRRAKGSEAAERWGAGSFSLSFPPPPLSLFLSFSSLSPFLPLTHSLLHASTHARERAHTH